MKIVKYHLYYFDYKKNKWIKLESSIYYTLNKDKTYAVKIKGYQVWIEIPFVQDSLTSRDISMFMIGRRSTNMNLIENLEKDIIIV